MNRSEKISELQSKIKDILLKQTASKSKIDGYINLLSASSYENNVENIEKYRLLLITEYELDADRLIESMRLAREIALLTEGFTKF